MKASRPPVGGYIYDKHLPYAPIPPASGGSGLSTGAIFHLVRDLSETVVDRDFQDGSQGEIGKSRRGTD